MNRRELVLAALAASDGAVHSPVQVQKLFFLLDKTVPSEIAGPHFVFRPLHYGPFDGAVYDELNELARQGLVHVGQEGNLATYRGTPQGLEVGNRALEALPRHTAAYIRQLSQWVRSQSFAALVSAIYNKYPEMQVNSVFRG